MTAILSVAWLLIRRRMTTVRSVAMFFAGLCLLANGAYITVGSFARVGDGGEMMQTGSPFWTLIAFGAVAIPLGLFVWHRLGSPRQFLSDPSVIPPRSTYFLLCILLVVLAAGFAFSPR